MKGRPISWLSETKRFFYRIYLWRVKNDWHVSKKGNFYNLSLGITVYRWGLSWNMVRHDIHHQGYDSKKSAMQTAFRMWLKEKLSNEKV
jgi:hypothetical protein